LFQKIGINEIIPYLNLNKLEDKGSHLVCCCPFHSDRNPSFVIYKNTYKCICFSCGEELHLYKLVKHFTGRNIFEILGLQDNNYKNFLFQQKNKQKTFVKPLENLKLKEVDIQIKGNIYNVHNSLKVMSYLRNRNITDQIINDWDIKYFDWIEIISYNSFNREKKINRYKNRVLIPIIENKKLINYALRDFTENVDKSKKELYVKFATSNTLFNYDNLDYDKPLYIVEGIMDLPLIYSYISKNCTGIFGINVTNRQIELLKKFKEIIVIPDNDEAGERLISILDTKLDDREFWIVKVKSEDPGASTLSELKECIDNKILSVEYMLNKYEILEKKRNLKW